MSKFGLKTKWVIFQIFAGQAFGVSFSMPSFADESEAFFRNLSGCFHVTFDCIENGNHDDKLEGLFEWIAPLRGEPVTFLQHFGLVPGESHAFKHWREEWTLNTDGTWHQKVIGPYGNFRYEGSARIEFNQWRSTARNAPKPRRDIDRSDYLTLDRENTLQVTPKGWVQSENNIKRDSNGVAVSNELCWNKYVRVDNSNCQVAIDQFRN